MCSVFYLRFSYCAYKTKWKMSEILGLSPTASETVLLFVHVWEKTQNPANAGQQLMALSINEPFVSFLTFSLLPPSYIRIFVYVHKYLNEIRSRYITYNLNHHPIKNNGPRHFSLEFMGKRTKNL